MTTEYVPSLAALARALGRPKKSVLGWSRRGGFPRKASRGYDVGACAAWVSANVRLKNPLRWRPSAEPEPEPEPREAVADVEVLADRLESAGADGLEASRAAVGLVSQLVATSARSGTLGPRDASALKATLEELRKSESGYLALERERGKLITRDEAKQVVGMLSARLDAFRATMRSILALQVMHWVEDRSFGKQSPQEQRRAIFAWFDEQTRSLRTAEADEIEAMVREVTS